MCLSGWYVCNIVIRECIEHVCSISKLSHLLGNYRSSAIEWLLICTDCCFSDRSMGNCFPFPWERYSQAYGQQRTERSTGAINITEWSIEISARLLYIMRLTVTCVVVLCGKARTGVPGCASNQFPCVFIRIFSLRGRLSTVAPLIWISPGVQTSWRRATISNNSFSRESWDVALPGIAWLSVLRSPFSSLRFFHLISA